MIVPLMLSGSQQALLPLSALTLVPIASWKCRPESVGLFEAGKDTKDMNGWWAPSPPSKPASALPGLHPHTDLLWELLESRIVESTWEATFYWEDAIGKEPLWKVSRGLSFPENKREVSIVLCLSHSRGPTLCPSSQD